MHLKLIPLALLGTLAVPVQASNPPEHTTIQGTYAIQVLMQDQGATVVKGCLVNGDASTTSTPFATNWGNHKCDTPPPGAPAEGHLWEVHNVGTMHVIRSRSNGYCLIRGQNGHAARPILHLWGLSDDPRYCGFPTADALIQNGQALWDFSALSRVYSSTTWLPQFQGPINLPKFPGSYLAFDPPAPGWHVNFSLFHHTATPWSVAFITVPQVLPVGAR